ncbi:MAG: methionyl-tRNA formyltransferase [Bacteroidota bacterium]
MQSEPTIVFMGTPEIAVASLEAVIHHGCKISAVVTVPDKPSGRGLHVHQSPVKECALANNLAVLQPDDLADPDFIAELNALHPDIIIVVAFRKLPDVVLNIPTMGAFNLHASLLPEYRGAAPINWAVINGETETGVTTFFLNSRIDAGKIILKRRVALLPEYNASALYDVLKTVGAQAVTDTIEIIKQGNVNVIDQDEITDTKALQKKAPKIFKEHCRIDWNHKTADIHNRIRGLSLHPGAFTDLISPDGTVFSLKILFSEIVIKSGTSVPGSIETDGKKHLHVSTIDGYLALKGIQLAGKKQMNVEEFLRGFRIDNSWHAR